MSVDAKRATIFGLTLAVASSWGALAPCQAPPPSRPVAPITADEKAAAERAVLSYSRTQSLLGAGQARVISTEVEPEKGETENFLAGRSATPPTRRVVVVMSNPRTNKAVRALVTVPQNQVIAVESIRPADIPLVRDDAEQALTLAKANPQLRRAVGDTIDRYAILEPGSQAQVPFAAQVLPVVSTSRNDPCASDRCVDLIFRTETGYLPVRAHVDLTRRTVAVHGGGRHR